MDKTEIFEALENTRNIMEGDISYIPPIGAEGNPFVCNIDMARNMKMIFSDDLWVCINNNSKMKTLQLKEIK